MTEPETQVGATALDLDPDVLAPLAWTLDEAVPDSHYRRAHRWRWLLAVGALAAALAAVAVAVFGLGDYRITTATPASKPAAASPAKPTSPFAALAYDPLVATVPLPEERRDNVYVEMLKKGGFEFVDENAEKVIHFARHSCASMKEGLPVTAVDGLVEDAGPARTGFRTDLTAVQRHFVINLAIGIYCPELMQR